MSVALKRQIPLGITLGICFFLLIDYFFTTPPVVSTFGRDLVNWGVVITAFAMTLGTVVLTKTHAVHLWKRSKGQWYYSALLLVILYAFLVTGTVLGSTHPSYSWLYNSTFSPLSATMYCSILPFMATACLRAFRAKNKQGALLLIVGGIVLLGNTSAIEIILPFLPDVKEWIMTVPNMAAYRGITIGAGLGTLLLGLRTMLGYERGYLGGKE